MKLKRTYKLLPNLTLVITRVGLPPGPSPLGKVLPAGLGIMDYKRREHIFYQDWSTYRTLHRKAYLRGVELFSDDDPSGGLKDVVQQSRHAVIDVPPLYPTAPRVNP